MRKSNFFSSLLLIYTMRICCVIHGIRRTYPKGDRHLDNNDFDYMIKEGNLKYILIAVPNKFGINRKAF